MSAGLKLVDYYNPKIETFPPTEKLDSVELLVRLALGIPNRNLLEYFLSILQHPAYFPNWHLSTDDSDQVAYSLRLANLQAEIENTLRDQ